MPDKHEVGSSNLPWPTRFAWQIYQAAHFGRLILKWSIVRSVSFSTPPLNF